MQRCEFTQDKCMAWQTSEIKIESEKRRDAGASATRTPMEENVYQHFSARNAIAWSPLVIARRNFRTVIIGLRAHDRHSQYDFVDFVYGNFHVLTVHRDGAMDIDRVCVLCKH